jgi:hypothetical protein
MENKELFFLDLEETVIRSFDNPRLVNIEKVKKFLHNHGATELHIFSYAIHSEADRTIFNRDIKPRLEEILELPIVSCPTIPEVMKADYELTGLFFSPTSEVTEYIYTRGKTYGFINYVNNKYNYTRAVLIDDTVADMTITYRNLGARIDFYNVGSL